MNTLIGKLYPSYRLSNEAFERICAGIDAEPEFWQVDKTSEYFYSFYLNGFCIPFILERQSEKTGGHFFWKGYGQPIEIVLDDENDVEKISNQTLAKVASFFDLRMTPLLNRRIEQEKLATKTSTARRPKPNLGAPAAVCLSLLALVSIAIVPFMMESGRASYNPTTSSTSLSSSSLSTSDKTPTSSSSSVSSSQFSSNSGSSYSSPSTTSRSSTYSSTKSSSSSSTSRKETGRYYDPKNGNRAYTYDDGSIEATDGWGNVVRDKNGDGKVDEYSTDGGLTWKKNK